MFALVKNENAVVGLKSSTVKAGISDADTLGSNVESGVFLPFPSDPQATWMYYDCTLSSYLDSGIVVHNRLPQVNNAFDTLASCDIAVPTIDSLKGLGVNLLSNDAYTDIVQRMAHSRYWFRLWGQAVRVGLQVPIPAAVKLGDGTKLIPHDENPQHGYNRLAGNWSGFPVYHAVWSLWYTTLTPPKVKVAPVAPNLAAHIGDVSKLPTSVQSPFSQPDDESVQQVPSLGAAIST